MAKHNLGCFGNGKPCKACVESSKKMTAEQNERLAPQGYRLARAVDEVGAHFARLVIDDRGAQGMEPTCVVWVVKL